MTVMNSSLVLSSQREENAVDSLCVFENLSQRLFYALNSQYEVYYQVW